MTEETLNDYVEKIQAFNMSEDKRFDVVHLKDAVMAGYNICRSECEKGDLEVAILIGALEEENIKLKTQIEKMKNRCNCKNGEYSYVGRAYFNCKLGINKCEGCDKWEIAE